MKILHLFWGADLQQLVNIECLDLCLALNLDLLALVIFYNVSLLKWAF